MNRFARIEFQLRVLQSLVNEEGGEVEVNIYLPGMAVSGRIAAFDESEAINQLASVPGIAGEIELVERKVRAGERARRVQAAMLGISVDELPMDGPGHFIDEEFFLRDAKVTMLVGEPKHSTWLAVRYDAVIAMEISETCGAEYQAAIQGRLNPFSR